MSSIVHKIKDAVTPDHKSSQPEGTSGPHTSRTANAADPRVDSDRDHRAANAYGTSTTAHDGSYTTSDNYTYGGTTGPATRTDGPHNSNAMNKADPRVDSDRDGSRNMGANPHGTATTSTSRTGNVTGTGLTGSHGTTGTTGTTGVGSTGYSTNAGPHNSNLMNKADPRVDSDRDHRATNTYGSSTTGTTGTTGLTGSHGTTGTGLTGSHGTTGTTGVGSTGYSTNAGPHNSNLMNKADPRVDSDRDHRANTYGTSTTGTTGTSGLTGTHGTTGTTGVGSTGYSTNAGPHNSNAMNKADPRVDSDRDGSRNMGANPRGTATTGTGLGTSTHTGTHGTSGVTGSTGTRGTSGVTGSTGTHGTTGLSSYGGNPGPAPNTAGPHKSDMMNKVDPRVDSDLDGSKTVGGDKTFTRPGEESSAAGYKDPTDAAQVPPSVLQKHIGPPTVAHDDDSHDRTRRHSVSHQEQHRGL